MNALVTVKDLNKQFSTKTLFRGLSLVISENEKMGIVGPNGAGKSTFFKILTGLEEADSGQLIFKRGLQIAYVPQTADFDLSKTALELAREVASGVTQSEIEELALANSCLLEMRLKEIDKPIEGFSGGEKKRLQIALGLCRNPQLLLLDEPTNHLDIGSIHELESILKQSSYAWAMISHDRSFLENTVKSMSEINPRYINGIFTCSGNYSNYRKRRGEFLEAEAKQRDSLESKVRMEEAWLRQGARARSTKAKGRINSANALIEDLAETKERQKEEKIKLSFTSSERKTKELAEFHKVSKGFEGKEIFQFMERGYINEIHQRN
jgi:ATP-binding cassette subfamily F protein uup